MTALDLYKFINKNNIEYHWNTFYFFNNDHHYEVFMMVDIPYLQEFYELLEPTIFDDEGIPCYMKDGYVVFEMSYICNYYDIDLKDVFEFDT
jgi:hypothetical protein